MSRAADAARLRGLVASTPHDPFAWHNLAAAEGDLGRPAAAEAAARRAIALGIGAPETRLVLARALQSLGRLDEAAAAFDETLRLKPGYADAHRDYAQLVWMRTGSRQRALERLDLALGKAPRDPSLHLVRSVVLEFAGDAAAALDAANEGLAHAPPDPNLLLQAAHLEAEAGDPERALALADRASTGGAGPRADIARCEALLASGRLDAIDAVLSPLARSLPANQYVIALQATTWRLRGDPRYATLCDYQRLVATRTLAPPSGYRSLPAFLDAVGAELTQMHQFVAHPFQQSVRGGGQLTFSEDDMRRPVIGALFQSIAAAVHAHLAELGQTGPGDGGMADPMRTRNTGRAAFSGAWSVRLSSGGSHVDHVHPQGWLSSACYLALPPTIGSGIGGTDGDGANRATAGVGATTPVTATGRAGWLRLGRPGIRTLPALEADHWIRPQPGLLALFPAYMWHGVEPFEGDTPRLSVAFDVIPG